MNFVIFRQTLRQNMRSLIVVSISVAAFFYIVLIAFKSFTPQGGAFSGFLRTPPKAVGAFLGGSADFLHPSGWVATTFAHPIILALNAAVAFGIGVGSVATELERQTLDLIMTRPISRSSYIVTKATACLVAVAIIQLAGVIALLIGRVTVSNVAELSIGSVFKAFLGAWVFFGSFAMIAMMISSRSSLRSRALGIATAVIVGSFFINFAALLFNGVSWLRYASLFHYFRPGDILIGKSFALDTVAVGAVGVLAFVAGLISFQRRDLTA